MTLIEEDDTVTKTGDSNSGFSISSLPLPSVSRRTMLISVILIFAVGGILGAVYTGAVSTDDIREVVSGVSDTTSGIVNDRVTTPADELVIQIDQLDLGWRVTSSGEDQAALFLTPVSSKDVPSSAYSTVFEKEETGERLISTAAVMNSSDEASNQYDVYMSNVSAEYSTESVDVGQEGLVYTDGGSTVIVFRDQNVFAVITHITETNRPDVNRTVEYAELMSETRFRDIERLQTNSGRIRRSLRCPCGDAMHRLLAGEE